MSPIYFPNVNVRLLTRIEISTTEREMMYKQASPEKRWAIRTKIVLTSHLFVGESARKSPVEAQFAGHITELERFAMMIIISGNRVLFRKLQFQRFQGEDLGSYKDFEGNGFLAEGSSCFDCCDTLLNAYKAWLQLSLLLVAFLWYEFKTCNFA